MQMRAVSSFKDDKKLLADASSQSKNDPIPTVSPVQKQLDIFF